MTPPIFKTPMHKDTKATLLKGLLVFFLLTYLGFVELSFGYKAQGYTSIVGGIIIPLLGFLFMVLREYPYVIYDDVIKFPFYWKLKNLKRDVSKSNIFLIKHQQGKVERMSGLLIITKNNKRYLIVKPYDNMIFPYLQEMMGDRWQEVYKG